MPVPNISSTSAPAPQTGEVSNDGLKRFTYTLFFIFGGITSLNDVLIPKMKELFTLDYGQAMLVQSAFFGAYLLISLPAAALVRRSGYLRAATVGLLLMMTGCLMFVPASTFGSYQAFLFALFVLAAGITIVQVVANPLISLLGPANTAHSRLTFAQAFNSLGTTLFPYVGSLLLLRGLATLDARTLSIEAATRYRAEEGAVIAHAYLGLTIALAVLAVAVWRYRNRLPQTTVEGVRWRDAVALLTRPRFTFGTASIFLYVGAEVAVGSLIVSYLMQASTLGLTDKAAGLHVPFYWGGAMVGRFIGALLLNRVSPGKLLAAVATAAVTLLVVSALSTGAISAWSLLAIGLCNAIMFPTIFSLASEGLGSRAADGSGIICMAIVGGAVIPPLTGHLADLVGVQGALALPALCYLVIACFGIYARKPA